MWPSLILASHGLAITARMTRSTMLEVLREEYIRTARAKGLREQVVIVRHALKNALIPVVTLVGTSFATLLGGTVVLELIFGIPGIGSWLVLSIALGTTTGYLLGVVSGYLGGWIDMILQRVMDTILALPPILMALALVAVLGSGVDKIIAAISIVYCPRAAPLSYGAVLSVKENVYVNSARVIGESSMRIIFRNILPNSLAPYLILASIALGAAILLKLLSAFLAWEYLPHIRLGAARSLARHSSTP